MDLYCSYASKPCPNPRAVRPNGQPHSFCEEHRRRANEAQKRWYSRQRQTSPSASHLNSKTTSPRPIKAKALAVESGVKQQSGSKAKVCGFASKRYGRVTFRSSLDTTATSPTNLFDLLPPLDSEQESFLSLLEFECAPLGASEDWAFDTPQTINSFEV
jgi:hypothetical protein